MSRVLPSQKLSNVHHHFPSDVCPPCLSKYLSPFTFRCLSPPSLKMPNTFHSQMYVPPVSQNLCHILTLDAFSPHLPFLCKIYICLARFILCFTCESMSINAAVLLSLCLPITNFVPNISASVNATSSLPHR